MHALANQFEITSPYLNYTKDLIQFFMTEAYNYSMRSKAKRLQVGAVFVRDGRAILQGFNGTLPKTSNECEDEFGNTKPTVLHAERNGICYAARKGISLEGSDLFVTHSPCSVCASLIAATGIRSVFYREEYRDLSGVDFLRSVAKIPVWRV